MSVNVQKARRFALSQTLSSLGFLLMFGIVLFVGGCSSLGSTYYEKHTLGELQVVFLDEGALHQKWTELSGERAASFDLKGRMESGVSLQVVRGFFDPTTNTIYCTKMDFEVCGRELHHAVVAQKSQQVVAQKHPE